MSFAGKRSPTKTLSGVKILASEIGKFHIYTPVSLRYRRRLGIVSRAASKLANRLGLDVEVTKTHNVLSLYVFYLSGDEEEVPLYCDLGKDWDEQRIYDSMRSVVYALSLLPEYGDLQPARGR